MVQSAAGYWSVANKLLILTIGGIRRASEQTSNLQETVERFNILQNFI